MGAPENQPFRLDRPARQTVMYSATFVGQVNFFEIWNPAAFKAHQAARRALRAPAPGS